jgi:hypothetical protein
MRYLLLLLLPFCAQAATVSLSTGANCTFVSASVDSSGNAFYSCGGIPTPNPVPLPAPAPTPVPAPVPAPAPTGTCSTPANMVMQTMYIGGTNNYAFDSLGFVNPPRGTRFNGDTRTTSPQNTVQVFPLPKTWPTGEATTHGSIIFTEYAGAYGIGTQYEIALSKCPGDFSYFETKAPECGLIFGSDNGISWDSANTPGYSFACQIPANEQWYLNWRVVAGTCVGYQPSRGTCGQVFGIPYSP